MNLVCSVTPSCFHLIVYRNLLEFVMNTIVNLLHLVGVRRQRFHDIKFSVRAMSK